MKQNKIYRQKKRIIKTKMRRKLKITYEIKDTDIKD